MDEKRLKEIERWHQYGEPIGKDLEAELIAEVRRSRAEARRLRRLVKASEWKAGASGSELGFCPWCDGWEETGHLEDCALVEEL